MGNSSSCCRWLSKHDPENDPFITEEWPSQSRTLPQTVGDVAAALKSGKLPSQSQIDQWARRILKSDILSFPIQRHGQLSPQAMKLVLDLRNFLDMLLVFGLEKNSDDKLQDFFYALRQLDATLVQIDPSIADETFKNLEDSVPSVSELDRDLTTILVCCRSLGALLVSSATFQALVSSFVFFIRQGLATAAENVNQVAQQVEVAASTVETVAGAVEKASETVYDAVKPDSVEQAVAPIDLEGLQAEARDVLTATVDQMNETRDAPSAPIDNKEVNVLAEDVAIQQIRDLLLEVQRNPQCITSLQIMLNIFKKHVDRLASLSSDAKAALAESTDYIHLSLDVTALLSDLKDVLERLAGGTHSLDRVVSLSRDILLQPRNSEWWSSLSEFLESLQVLISKNPDDLASTAGTSLLAEKWKALQGSERDPRVTHLLQGLSTFLSAMQQDRTLNRFIATIQTLFVDATHYVSKSSSEAKNKMDILWNDLRVYVIPKLFLGAMKLLWRPEHGMPLPLPRVEFVDETLEGVLDPRFTMVSSSERRQDPWCDCPTPEDDLIEEDVDWTEWVLPSTVRIQQWNEMEIDLSGNSDSSITTSDSIRIRLSDIVSASTLQEKIFHLRGMLFYLNHKSFPAYKDEGRLDLDVEFNLGREGADLDIEFEIHTATPQTSFRVKSVHLSLPDTIRLYPTIRQSKHWMLNNILVNPIALPIVKFFLKRYLGKMIQEGIKEGLQSLGDIFFKVPTEAKSRQTDESAVPTLQDWWNATLNVLSPDAPASATATTVSLAGVQVHKFVPEEQDSSTIAVGVVPQLVPDKAVPADTSQQVVEEVSETVESVITSTEEVVAEGVETVGSVRDGASEVQERYQNRRAAEIRRDGWRSEAFG